MSAHPLYAAQETIVAVATPPGRGGIGVIRLSGPQARAIAEPIVRSRRPLAAGCARYAELLDPASLESGGAVRVLDQAVVTYYAAPHSYTSDDVVEISLHGAPVLLDAVLRYAVSHGARLAEPGEFTQRAFLSGRLDLTGAEAVRDLIDASTLHQARIASAQLGGSISRSVAPVKRELVTLIAVLEAGIDFAEDDLHTLSREEICAGIAGVLAPLDELAATFPLGRATREGFQVALAGQPNAGKSSLFNRLLGRERAIVTAQPGTTRDAIHEQFSAAGIPVELIDTAGLRELSADGINEAELAGMGRSRATIAEAHHVLLVVDGTALGRSQPELASEDVGVLETLAGRPCIVVLNKADLLSAEQRTALLEAMPAAVLVSAVSGEGIDRLRLSLEDILGAQPASAEATLVTNVRQQSAIDTAREALRRADDATVRKTPHEMLLLDLYAALGALDELTGNTMPDAILDEIFSTFCIGK